MFLIVVLLLVSPKVKARTVAKLSGLVTAFNRALNTMMRIVDRVIYESKPAEFLRMKATDLGNGHLEVTAYRPHVWHEWDHQPADLDAWIAETEVPTKQEQQENALRLLQDETLRVEVALVGVRTRQAGSGVLDFLAAEFPAVRRVLMSSDVNAAALHPAQVAGAHAILGKPPDAEELALALGVDARRLEGRQ